MQHHPILTRCKLNVSAKPGISWLSTPEAPISATARHTMRLRSSHPIICISLANSKGHAEVGFGGGGGGV